MVGIEIVNLNAIKQFFGVCPRCGLGLLCWRSMERNFRIHKIWCAPALLAWLGLTFIFSPLVVHGEVWNYEGPEEIVVLTSGQQLVRASVANASLKSTPKAITGVVAGETLVAIDYRPINQRLYGLGVNASNNTATLYHLSAETAFAVAIGQPSAVAFTMDGVSAVDMPDPEMEGWDIDFDPVADRLHVVAGLLSFRVDPNLGLPVDGDHGAASPSAGINPDAPPSGATGRVGAVAFSNSRINATFSGTVTFDSTSDSLFSAAVPYTGNQTLISSISTLVGGMDVSRASLDIANIPIVGDFDSGYLHVRVGEADRLFQINLSTSALSALGTFALPVRCIAVKTALGAALLLTGNGGALVRFDPLGPRSAESVQIDVSVLPPGEVLVAVDGRPQTGQLYGLGIDAIANTGTLYLIDPKYGSLTPVGTPSEIKFVTDGTPATGEALPINAPEVPLDFPDPSTTNYGFDFSPVADVIRVVAGNLNFRLSPITGKSIDGKYGRITFAVSPVLGLDPEPSTPDNLINGGAGRVDAIAYTNSYGQPVGQSIQPAFPTTLYAIDVESDTLYIQNSPNTGILTAGIPITSYGTPRDLTSVTGFDIAPHVAVGSYHAPASGEGWLLWEKSPSGTALGRINLQTADVEFTGDLGAVNPLGSRGLVVWAAPPRPPQWGGITPNDGRDKGGYSATVSGSSFLGASRITIGGVEAKITSHSEGHITFTVPPGEGGLADVMVTTPGGTFIAEDVFEYILPTKWEQNYEMADRLYVYFAASGDRRSALAYWFYFRAWGDREFRNHQGNAALAEKEFHQGMAYFYYTILEGQYGRLYYYFLHLGYAEYTSRKLLGDDAGASVYFQFYYNQALTMLAFDPYGQSGVLNAGVHSYLGLIDNTAINIQSWTFNHWEGDPSLRFGVR